MLRPVVKFDEAKCIGCGDCIPSCAEGAIAIVNDKATLIRDIFCDGLGACLGECPEDAISIEEREAEAFDEAAVTEHLASTWARHSGHAPAGPAMHVPLADLQAPSCPSTRIESFDDAVATPSGLAPSVPHWPIKLNLVPPGAPFLDGADLMLVADCVSFANPSFHAGAWSDRALVIGCPKFDDPDFGVHRLTEILRRSDVRSLTVVHMEVPCCGAYWYMGQKAVAASGKSLPLKQVVVNVDGATMESADPA